MQRWCGISVREAGDEQVGEGWRKQENSYSGQEYWRGMLIPATS